MKNSDFASIDYSLLEQEKALELQDDLTKKLKSSGLGKIHSLRHSISNFVVYNQYEAAKKEMQRYFDQRKGYPLMVKRTERYLSHCVDLINAIESKRTFPGLATLSLAKRQELFDKVVDHFEELKQYLKQIEMIDKETLIDDMRSTALVVKVAMHSVFFIMLLAFFIDVTTGLGKSFNIVLTAFLDDITNSIFRYFNW